MELWRGRVCEGVEVVKSAGDFSRGRGCGWRIGTFEEGGLFRGRARQEMEEEIMSLLSVGPREPALSSSKETESMTECLSLHLSGQSPSGQ